MADEDENTEPTTDVHPSWTEEDLRKLEKGWEEGGVVYQDPDYVTHPIERDEVVWRHIWPPQPPAAPIIKKDGD